MEGKKKYCAYPFLYDEPSDLRCDFEIFTDEISSTIGLLRSFIKEDGLRSELSKVNEMVYHMNPSLRTKVTIKDEEVKWLSSKVSEYEEEVKDRFNKFVLPQGGISGSYSHILRTKCKSLVRMLHRYEMQGNKVEDKLYQVSNLLSGYFFLLALKLNKDECVEEVEFVSRNYK